MAKKKKSLRPIVRERWASDRLPERVFAIMATSAIPGPPIYGK